ncbi:hypothetical protein MalM25_32790 [Planctomycetes bacterium MalM25]|nr:hypothetical protein MalM25_32790 [Planctomycetes bacterium MalM25]
MSRPGVTLAIATLAIATLATAVDAGNGWNGYRRVSRQRPNDLFYNYYVGPNPSGTAAGMYVSPQPVPPAMGHTYTTYQPFMPHEMLYGHKRSYYTHHAGSGWTRTKVRYGAYGNRLQAASFGLFDDTAFGHLKSGSFFNHLDVLNVFDY